MLNRFEMFSSAISAAYRCLQKLERDEMESTAIKVLLRNICLRSTDILKE